MEYSRGLAWDLSCFIFLSVPWRRQWSAHSSSLQMTPVSDQATCWRAELPFRDTQVGWRNKLKRTLGTSARRKAKCCPREGSNPAAAQHGERQAKEQLCRKGPGGQLSTGQPCTLAGRTASSLLGCISKGTASRSREEIILP